MIKKNRRQFLQATAVVATSSALGASADPMGAGAPGALSAESGLYDAGMVPVSASRWYRDDQERVEYPPLELDIDTDVLVVGGGLAGASVCLHLAEAGVQTALIEHRQPGWGASGRNAGHVLPLIRDLKQLASFPGEGQPFLEYFTHNKHLPFELAQKHAIDCDASRVGLLEAISSESNFDRASALADRWRSRYQHNVRRIAGSEMREVTGSERYAFGILWEDGGRINPYLFTRGMIASASAMGAKIFGDSAANNIRKHGHKWQVSCDKGSVTASKVVFCTNAYTPGILPGINKTYSPVIAYTLSTKPIADELQKLIMPSGSTMEQYPLNLHSFLIDRSGRMLTSLLPRLTNPEDGRAHFGDLQRWLHKTWPESRDFDIEMEDYWTGRTAMATDGFPKIFQLESDVYALTNFSGWGNLTAPMLGKHLAEAIAAENMSALTVPLSKPEKVSFPGWQDFFYRGLMLPLARTAERLSLV